MISPVDFIEMQEKQPETFKELMDAYTEWVGYNYDLIIESGEEFDTVLIQKELSFDRFHIALWKKGQE